MANRQDVEMLQNALQTLGQGALQRRQLETQNQQEMQKIALEAQLRDISEKRYDAYIGHNQNMEERLQNQNDNASQRNAILANSEADKAKIAEQGQKAAEDFATAKDGLTQFTQTLKANRQLNAQDPTKGLSQADAAKMFQSSMDALPPAMHQQMLSSPQYQALYQGKIDFGTLPDVDAKGAPAAPPMDERTVTIHHPAVEASPGAPANVTSHWFSPDTTNSPAIPPTTASPAWDEVLRQHVANGGGITPAPAAAAAPGALPAAAAPATPPPAHIAMLKADPSLAAQFDQKYGQGASAQYLQPQTPQAAPPQPIPGGGGMPIGLPATQPTSGF